QATFCGGSNRSAYSTLTIDPPTPNPRRRDWPSILSQNQIYRNYLQRLNSIRPSLRIYLTCCSNGSPAYDQGLHLRSGHGRTVTVVQLNNSSPSQNTPSSEKLLKLSLSHQVRVNFVRLVQGVREIIAGYADHYATADLEGLSKQFSMAFVEYVECPTQSDHTESNWLRLPLQHFHPPNRANRMRYRYRISVLRSHQMQSCIVQISHEYCCRPKS